MKKKLLRRLVKLGVMVKAPKFSYLVRHPLKGPKNLLALRGAKSLLKTRGAAVTGAALATAAVAFPLAARARKDQTDS